VVRPSFFPPIGLEIVAAALEKHARAIDVLDLRRETKRTVDFLRPETDLVAFSVNWDKEADSIREEIRSVPPRVLTILGGRHVTEYPERWLADCPNLDILVRGDGEEVVEDIAGGLPLEKIAGISYRRDGKVVHGPNREPGPAPDDLYPRRRLRRYVYTAEVDDFDTHVTVDCMATSRGCPYNCTYCSFGKNPWGTKRQYTTRSPESVVDELGEIEAKVVIFTDDNFSYDADRVERMCDLIIERGIRKRYLANARLEIAKRPEVVRKMTQAGFWGLFLGIESTQDRTLRSMRKGFDVAKIREYFRVLRRSNIILHGYFILGNIGETEKDMLSIPRFAHQLGLDMLGLSLLRTSRYSGLNELVAASPGYHVAPDGHVYSDDCSVQYLRRMKRRINWKFYTPGHAVRVLKKFLDGRYLTPGMLARYVFANALPRALRKLFRRK
jgi:radical SAM superfamily enzyme YgiQ (UPF0313 family)